MKEYVHGLFTTSGKLHIKLYAAACILLSRTIILCLVQMELAAIVMEDFIHFLQAAVV